MLPLATESTAAAPLPAVWQVSAMPPARMADLRNAQTHARAPANPLHGQLGSAHMHHMPDTGLTAVPEPPTLPPTTPGKSFPRISTGPLTPPSALLPMTGTSSPS
jgi:hypothetical protein